jgi:3',5'-cyclic AMP phosphodiesterase CpdA
VLIAQISDPHVMLPDDPIAGFVDTPARLRDVIAALEVLPVRADVVLLTGDLVNRGLPREYALLREVLAPLTSRLLVIPGNHDDPVALRDAFGDQPELPETGHLSYVIDDLPVRLIGIDTTVAGRDDGELDEQRLTWLAATLDEGDGRPTILFMHHPPAPTGMWWMDYGGLTGRDRLRSLVARHPEVVRILAGHVHRSTTTSWGSTLISTAPSPFYAASAPIGDLDVPYVIAAPAPIPMFRWDADVGMLIGTELDPPGVYVSLPLPSVIGDRWDEYRTRARSGAEMPAHR